MDYEPTPQLPAPAESRDAGLAKLSRLRRTLAIASVALVGGFAALVAQAKPGKSTGSTTAPAPARQAPAKTRAAARPRFAQAPLRASSLPAPPSSGDEGAPATPSAPPPAPATVSPPPAPPAPAPAAQPPAVVSGGS
jgi:hypothetical protein